MTNEIPDQLIADLRAGAVGFLEDPREVRRALADAYAAAPLVESVARERTSLGGVGGVWHRPPGAPGDRAILYFHGGGYIAGSADTHGGVAGQLALDAGTCVFVPDYRLAPEHPFPAAAKDALACYQALRRYGQLTVALAGDSAGGGLALSLLVEIKQQRLAMPACAVLWSPWVDLRCEGASVVTNADVDPMLSRDDLLVCARHYVGDNIPDDPRLDVLRGDLSGLPPLLVQAGSIEILLSDALSLSHKAAHAHVRTRLDVYPGMPHVFQGFHFMFPEGTVAIRDSAAFIQRHFV